MIADGIPPARLIPTVEKTRLVGSANKITSCEPRGSVAQTGARYEPGNANRTVEFEGTNVGRLCGEYEKQSWLRGRIVVETGKVWPDGPLLARH